QFVGWAKAAKRPCPPEYFLQLSASGRSRPSITDQAARPRLANKDGGHAARGATLSPPYDVFVKLSARTPRRPRPRRPSRRARSGNGSGLRSCAGVPCCPPSLF